MSHWRAIFDSRSPMCKNVPLGTGKKASTTKTTPTYIFRPKKKKRKNIWKQIQEKPENNDNNKISKQLYPVTLKRRGVHTNCSHPYDFSGFHTNIDVPLKCCIIAGNLFYWSSMLKFHSLGASRRNIEHLSVHEVLRFHICNLTVPIGNHRLHICEHDFIHHINDSICLII